MGKQALVIARAHAPLAYQDSKERRLVNITSDFFNTPTALADRDTCETNEQLLQLLPYIVLRDLDGDVFTYSRGQKGGEDRLKGNMSIGLGGHVDIEPNQQGELLGLLQAEAARELEEEVGIKLPPEAFIFTHLICDPTNAVGRVHIGLLCTVQLSVVAEKLNLEKDIIEKGSFLPVHDLINPDFYERLENWSAEAASYLNNYA